MQGFWPHENKFPVMLPMKKINIHHDIKPGNCQWSLNFLIAYFCCFCNKSFHTPSSLWPSKLQFTLLMPLCLLSLRVTSKSQKCFSQKHYSKYEDKVMVSNVQFCLSRSKHYIKTTPANYSKFCSMIKKETGWMFTNKYFIKVKPMSRVKQYSKTRYGKVTVFCH